MLRYLFLLPFFFLGSLLLHAQHPPVFKGMTMDTTYIVVSDLNVNLVRYAYGAPKVSFLAIHDNEDTGVKAAFEYMQFNGGRLVDCQYGGVRNFKFKVDGVDYQTDPNSIYTRDGIRVGLEKYGPADEKVMDQLEMASKVILNLYNHAKYGYIFTLHNNADGGFGIPSYLKGYELEGTADSLHINFAMDPDDLVFVTEKKLFDYLKRENVNVALQSHNAPDDGSLSVYAMKHSIPYINVEVQHGKQAEHLRLIEISVKALFACYPELKEKAGTSDQPPPVTQ
ncbi:hypothetical protein [Pedobacter faecalis]|uniref:hypothetical protein n=1 Tax=Pedobacter faecalis TaxID=3041495 RepID=UPI00254BD272|nr:hypothetical protein [Pedobacter sp. ELA7]